MEGRKITDARWALEFMLAGNATMTLVSEKTGTRYTYKLRASRDGKVHFVSVMYGPDNEGDFVYMGTLREGTYAHGRKSSLATGDVRSLAFRYAWSHLSREALPPMAEIWHEGRCGRCNRKLTVPESIERGIGPECAKMEVA